MLVLSDYQKERQLKRLRQLHQQLLKTDPEYPNKLKAFAEAKKKTASDGNH